MALDGILGDDLDGWVAHWNGAIKSQVGTCQDMTLDVVSN